MNDPVAFDARTRFAGPGRTVLITGAAHGIGQAMAEAFAAGGWQVARVDLPGERPYQGSWPEAVRWPPSAALTQ